jgi:Nuclease-related domain
MDELFTPANMPWLAVVAVAVLLLVWFFYRRHHGGNKLKRVLAEISHDRIDQLVIPNGDDGEIQIDHLVLTSQGLLIVDIKDAVGTVFGSDKMQEWTVISDERRYTFPNPQEALYDRIAAVGHIVRQVPVAGRILFLDGAEFTKGIPSLVSDLDQLLEEFGEPDKSAAKFKIEAFKPHWDLIRKAALGTQVDQMYSKKKL